MCPDRGARTLYRRTLTMIEQTPNADRFDHLASWDCPKCGRPFFTHGIHEGRPVCQEVASDGESENKEKL